MVVLVLPNWTYSFKSWIFWSWMSHDLQMLGKARSLFIKEYNHRLFNWLVAFSLVMVIVGRFVIKFFLIEIGAWLLFIFLEIYTRMFWSAETLYYSPVWQFVVATWETIVYSPILDLDRLVIFLVIEYCSVFLSAFLVLIYVKLWNSYLLIPMP